jgi:Fur family transcriptional regulator, zinc uptake regulator
MSGPSGVRTPLHRAHRKKARALPGKVLDGLILEILSGTNVPLSAYAIADRVRDRGGPGYVMTIYRALGRLADREAVERVESLSAYRKRSAWSSVLLVCSRCGVTTSLPVATAFNVIVEAVGATGFRLEKLALEAVGTCARCHSD